MTGTSSPPPSVTQRPPLLASFVRAHLPPYLLPSSPPGLPSPRSTRFCASTSSFHHSPLECLSNYINFLFSQPSINLSTPPPIHPHSLPRPSSPRTRSKSQDGRRIPGDVRAGYQGEGAGWRCGWEQQEEGECYSGGESRRSLFRSVFRLDASNSR